MTRRKLTKGQPLTELVDGSYNYIVTQLRASWQQQFMMQDQYWNWCIVEYFPDYVIVSDDQQPPDDFWLVRYTQTGDGVYTFAARDQWESVELTYTPAAANEIRERRERGQIALVERIERARITLGEAQSGRPRRIMARGMTADMVNNNNRRYPSAVLEAAVNEAQGKVAAGEFLAESNHPSDKGGVPDILESLVRWDSLTFENGEVLLEGTIIPTSKGQDLITVMEAGVYPRLSQRAYGAGEMVDDHGMQYLNVTELHLTGYDLVMDPGDPTAETLMFERSKRSAPTPPPRHQPTLEDSPTMDKITLESLRADYPELVAQIERERDNARRAELEEALQQKQAADARDAKLIAEREKALRTQLGLSDTDDLAEAMQRQATELQRLQEAEQARAVEQYIQTECAQIKYSELLRDQFLEAVKSAGAKTIDEAKAVIVAKRKEYDAIQAKLALAARGHSLQILGPVLERDRGIPEFARVSHELTESLIRAGHVSPRDLRAPRNTNERFTALYLERFDKVYAHHLRREAALYDEAEQTSDLNLPYSVSRAIIAEALPDLIATSIFDVQMVDPAPTVNIFFEQYAAESGATATVTDEVVVGDHDAWVQLDNKRLQFGTVVLTNSGGSTTYDEGDDYVVDYANGRLMTLSAGATTDGQSLKIDYVYDAIRKGERQAIERGKQTLSFIAVPMAADRLAAEITSEAIVFSRAALGYDARNATLMRLIKQIQRKIDGGLFYLALAAALRQADNSGGTWVAASDDPSELAEKIGVAKVKVANRFYEPTAVLMSMTNSDRLANWIGFTQAGSRPDADLQATGYVGRVKGLPVFASTNFTDNYVLPLNREIVQHRVGQPMAIKGPFPSYSSNQLLSSEQWFAEEFNASETPVISKAAYVKVS